MFKPAFSTVACPELPVEDVASLAARLGFAGVELRTFGGGRSKVASDPALTDPAKVRGILAEAGVKLAGLGTGVVLDKPVFPPVVGLLLPTAEAGVAEGRRAVELASACGAAYVRVFGFDLHGHETRKAGLRRIGERLAKVADHARHRDVKVVVENGGAFCRAEDLRELVDFVASPQLGVCYDIKAAHDVGDDVLGGAALLAKDLVAARLRDVDASGRPVALGRGVLPCEVFCAAVARTDAWLVYSWDALWVEGLARGEAALAGVVEKVFGWAGVRGNGSGVRAA